MHGILVALHLFMNLLQISWIVPCTMSWWDYDVQYIFVFGKFDYNWLFFSRGKICVRAPKLESCLLFLCFWSRMLSIYLIYYCYTKMYERLWFKIGTPPFWRFAVRIYHIWSCTIWIAAFKGLQIMLALVLPLIACELNCH